MPKSKIRITLRRSLIGQKPKTRATVRGLGLRKLHTAVEHPDTPDIRGMVHRVRHMVEVEEL